MPEPSSPQPTRQWIARGFTLVEDIVYVGLGALLALTAFALLLSGAVALVHALGNGEIPASTVALLDRILLILLVVELLYTVQVSFREHAIVPEPFVLVGLIAGVRRVLVLTAEFGEVRGKTDSDVQHFAIELGVLTALLLALTAALVLLRRQGQVVAPRV